MDGGVVTCVTVVMTVGGVVLMMIVCSFACICVCVCICIVLVTAVMASAVLTVQSRTPGTGLPHPEAETVSLLLVPVVVTRRITPRASWAVCTRA